MTRQRILWATTWALGCGHTLPEERPGKAGVDTGPEDLGHAPELVGFALDFEETTGTSMLVATARLGDLDDDLVPDGSVSALLRDDQGRERASLDAVAIGAAPTALPEPTLLRVEFGIASDPAQQWDVQLFVTDRGGLSSDVSKAVWRPAEDSGAPTE